MSFSSSPPRNLLILYATETGTAQDVSNKLARELRTIHFNCEISSIDKYPLPDLILEPLILFVISTTGSGSPPRSMLPLWSTLLRSDLPSDLLDEISYSIFALGDSGYEKFCWAGKLMNRRLGSLGAKEVVKRGEGDERDRKGIEDGFERWLKDLLSTLLELYPLPEDMTVIPPDMIYPPRIALTPTNPPTNPEPLPIDIDPEYCTATLVGNKRITALDWTQDVRNFEFEFDDDLSYAPGDSVLIHPSASPTEVQTLLDILNWPDPDTTFLITHTQLDQSLPAHLPTRATLRDILTHHVHITSTPRREFFPLLLSFSPTPSSPSPTTTEKERLEEFLSSDEGADDLHAYAFLPHRTILEVLSEFTLTARRIPPTYVFDLFPPLLPREFSIANSVLYGPKPRRRVELCVAIVNYRTMLKIPRKGVCTKYLSSLSLGSKLRIKFNKALFTLPDAGVPVICVGPGTGVAPMRAIIQHRLFHPPLPDTAQTRGETRLYFGCRHASKDQHYASEFLSYAQKPDNRFVYRVACSRDGKEGEKRRYVQDIMGSEGDADADARVIWDLVGKKGGYVYISGSSNKMPSAIRSTLRKIAMKEGGMGEDEAGRWVASLERVGRLVEECWS